MMVRGRDKEMNMVTPLNRSFAIFLGVVLAIALARWTSAQPEEGAKTPSASSNKSNLADGQKRVQDEFKSVEQLIIRLAESYAKTDPKKAAILRQTFAA